MKRFWIAAVLLVCHLGAQPADVPLTNRDTRSIVVVPGSQPGLVAFAADPAPAGGDLFQIVLSKSGTTVSLLLPDGTEISAANADQMGYNYTAVGNGAVNGSYVPSALAVNGDQVLIQLAPSAPVGQYQVKVDAGSASGNVLVVASYFSSSPVRVGLLASAPVYSVGDTVVLSGLAFEGGQALNGVSATVRIVDPSDGSATPVEVKLDDFGKFDAAVGDGIYTGTFTATKPGTFTAALRATGLSSTCMNYSRTAVTTFRVQPPLAKFVSVRDFAVDDDGDGVIDRLAVNGSI